jgi:hypothetical protein
VGLRALKTVILFGLLASALAGFLFAEYSTTADAPGWLRLVSIKIQAASRDAATQWMVVICLLSYFVTFLILARRVWPQKGTEGTKEKPGGRGQKSEVRGPFSFFARFVRFCGKSSDAWLCAFVVLVLLRYAFDYANAVRSLQVVVLLTGVVVGKGVALWAERPAGRATISRGTRVESREPDMFVPSSIFDRPSSFRRLTILFIITVLLAVAALWQPERGMEFFYRGQQRWTGPWDNPNLFGVLMGVGAILAVGMLVASCRFQVAGLDFPRSRGWRVSRLKILFQVLLFSAAGLCAYGLLKSYSRGAWLGTAVGLGFLLWKWLNREPREIHEKLTREKPATFNLQPATILSFFSCHSCVSWLKRNWLPISVLLISAFVLCFWQFRHTESPLARRVFSVGNPNDFSWRNRVAAWEGAGRMMWDKPLVGFGWGKAEEIYSKEYRAARLEESAAVQLNDYLMIGISAGGPASACLILYLWLALSRSDKKVRHLTGSPHPQPLSQPLGEGGVGLSPIEAEREAERSTINFPLSTIAASGAIVLMICFWFDGGLFKLPTAVVFWVLLELARGGFLTAKHTEHTKCGHGRFWSFFRVFRVVRGSREVPQRLVSGQASPSEREEKPNSSTAKYPKYSKTEIALRWLAGIFAIIAFGLTALHLGTPQLAVSQRTLNIARKFLVPPQEQVDFEFLAAKPIWGGSPLKPLLQHAHLANYNRTLVNWKLEDQIYREFVLSPEINFQPSTFNPQPPGDFGWRRPLWEHFYPRVRKESSLEAAAELVARYLGERVAISEAENLPVEVPIIWQGQMTPAAGFERIYVAALRSAGIPARLSETGAVEFWNGSEWKPAPRLQTATKSFALRSYSCASMRKKRR